MYKKSQKIKRGDLNLRESGPYLEEIPQEYLNSYLPYTGIYIDYLETKTWKRRS